MKPFLIRPLNFKQERTIADVLMDELHESERHLNPRTARWATIREGYLRHVEECLQEADGVFLIAEIEDEVVGFLFGYVHEPDDSDFEGGEGNDLYVSEGYVKVEHRKKGIYTALNAAFEAHYQSQNIRRIYRYTLAKNPTMHRWLESQGYQAIRVVYEKWI